MSDNQTALANGLAQSVNVNLGHGFRHLILIIGALIFALIASTSLAINAYIEASRAETQLELNNFWQQRLIIRLEAHGLKYDKPPVIK